LKGVVDGSRAAERRFASKGGKSAHEQGKAHEFTTEEARKAGTKGGRAVAKDRAHMARIGRQGGLARKLPKRARESP
jgi:uncharacterized protein